MRRGRSHLEDVLLLVGDHRVDLLDAPPRRSPRPSSSRGRPRRRSSRRPPRAAPSMSSASWRALRMATLHSSPYLRAIFTNSLRRSSVSGGSGMRTRSPSTCGLSPRSLSRMAFSTALTWRLVPRLDREEARLGHVDVRHLRERRRRPVVVDLDAVEQARARAARAQLRQLALERIVRLGQRACQVLLDVVDHTHGRIRRLAVGETLAPGDGARKTERPGRPNGRVAWGMPCRIDCGPGRRGGRIKRGSLTSSLGRVSRATRRRGRSA